MVPQLSGAEALLDGGRQGRSRGRVRSIGLWQVDAAICPPDGTGAVEELPLELRGNSIPAQKHGCAQALQNLVFFLSEGSTVLVILFPLNRLIEMNCQRVQSFLRINTANKKRSIASSLPCGGDE
jgi:hypothetical protein